MMSANVNFFPRCLGSGVVQVFRKLRSSRSTQHFAYMRMRLSHCYRFTKPSTNVIQHMVAYWFWTHYGKYHTTKSRLKMLKSGPRSGQVYETAVARKFEVVTSDSTVYLCASLACTGKTVNV